jgi:hypothetical protein
MKLKTIDLVRAEGPTALCGPAPTVATWQDANNLLRNWSDTAPATGGYDKCDFKLVLEAASGQELVYHGRYDLKHWKLEVPALTRHMLETAMFAVGAFRPDHLDERQYQQVLDKHYPREAKLFYAELLATADLLDPGQDTTEDWRTQAHHAYFCRTLDDGGVHCYIWTDDDEDLGQPNTIEGWDEAYNGAASMEQQVGRTRFGVSGVRVLVVLDGKVIL